MQIVDTLYIQHFILSSNDPKVKGFTRYPVFTHYFRDRMKIAVNTRLLLKNKIEGIGRFSEETLKRITANMPEHEFLFIFDREWHDDFMFSKNITPISVAPPTRHPFLMYAWFEWMIPPVLRKNNCDLFLSPDGHISLNSDIKQLPVIHDLNFEHYPKLLPKTVRNYYKFYFPKYAAAASRIATVSEYSANDIANRYKIERSKIDVVYNGVSSEFMPLSENEIHATRKRFSAGAPYFVYAGALQPRKNIDGLLKAFEHFKNSGDFPHKLVLVGEKRWWGGSAAVIYEKMAHQRDVIFTGRLNGADLNCALSASTALVYVSLFEGFGIPILEAMAAETAVITSGITSMPEVAGNAALKVSPFDSKNIAEAMKSLAADPQLRKELIEKGKERKNVFTWDRTANLLGESIEKVLGK